MVILKKSATSSVVVPKWYKRGAASHVAVEKAEQEQQEKYESMGRMWRFYLAEGEEAMVTFVDGELSDAVSEDGKNLLDILTYREHHLNLQGKWGNFFVCTQEMEPCPICEDGDEASLVGVLTVIDHRKVPSKKSPGKFYECQRKLYVAKKNTIKMLQKFAENYEGIAGCTFTISRVGENSPNVGSTFIHNQKNTIEELQDTFQEVDEKTKKLSTYFIPADYEKEINYVEAAELRKRGYGTQVIGHPMSAGAMGGTPTGKGIQFKGKV